MTPSTEHIKHPQGFDFGWTPLTQKGEAAFDTGMNLSVLKLKKGESYELTSKLESACLLMSGEVVFEFMDQKHRCQRSSCFKEDPFALHLPAQELGRVNALQEADLLLLSTDNERHFKPMFFTAQNMLESEHRGQGLLDDTAYRIVRTIFDIRNRPESNLVLGEVVTFPGRWSSYPPHHHPQAEIYHYRFSEPQGYGHAELGEEVVKIKHNDTIKILAEKDHAQVAAPGYSMLYVWAIRHLPNNPYTVPEFTAEHAWTKEEGANKRVIQFDL